MQQFIYRAALPDGRIQRGALTAATESELGYLLRLSNLTLIEARVQRLKLPLPKFFRSQGVTLVWRQQFFAQLADLLEAGVKLPEALDSLAESEPQPLRRALILRLKQALLAGTELHAAFARIPSLANSVQCALLQASATSNLLVQALRQIADQLRWLAITQAALRRGLRYPLFLLLVAIGVTGFMLAAVVPQVTALLQTLAADLPFLTRCLIATSEIFLAYGWILPLLVLGGGLLLRFLYRTQQRWALRLDRWALALPVFGPMLRAFGMARFCHNAAALIGSGLRLPEALAIAAEVTGNSALRRQALQVRDQVLAGCSLAVAMQPLLTPPEQQMLRIGEQSGQWVKALARISAHYQTTMQLKIEMMIGALEPSLTLLVGGLLAWVVLAVLGPIYGSLGILSKAM